VEILTPSTFIPVHRSDEQHTGIILTSEVCVREEHSGDLANGRERISDRPVERTGVPERTSYTTYTVTGL
jgi:hypothetical protein